MCGLPSREGEAQTESLGTLGELSDAVGFASGGCNNCMAV